MSQLMENDRPDCFGRSIKVGEEDAPSSPFSFLPIGVKVIDMAPVLRAALVRIATILLAVMVTGCSQRTDTDHQEGATMPQKSIEEVLKAHTDELMAIPGVVGTAQGLFAGKPCIKVYVVKKTPDLEKRVPDSLEGYPVVIEETGEIRARPEKGG